MLYDEFKTYMDQQISEIIKYRNDLLKHEDNENNEDNDNINNNKCIFEWISKNAKVFREKWLKIN